MNILKVDKVERSAPVRRRKENSDEKETSISIPAKTDNEQHVKARLDSVSGILEIELTKNGGFDSKTWYTIKKDGSGFSRTCWNPKASYCQKGALKRVYEDAESVFRKKGEIPKDNAVKYTKIFAQNAKEPKTKGFDIRF